MPSTERDDQSFDFYSGDYQELVITVYSNDTTSIKDLTGASATWVLSRNVDSTGIIILSTTSTGESKITISNATGGELTVALASSLSTALSGKFYHQCVIVDSSTRRGTVLSGDIIIRKSNS